jgi:hypothetical protein
MQKSKHIEIINNTFINSVHVAIDLYGIGDNYTANNEAVCIISENRIINSGSGIQLGSIENNVNISNNYIESGRIGIVISGEGLSDNPMLVNNNIIYINANNQVQTVTGIGVYNCNKILVTHNTVMMEGELSSSFSSYDIVAPISISSFGSDKLILNNDFNNYIYHDSLSYSIHADNYNAVTLLNNNNLYNNSPRFAKWIDDVYTTKNEFVSATGFQSNGVNTPSGFAIDTDNKYFAAADLRTLGSDLTTNPDYPLTIDVDINNESRNISAPTIGAIENKRIIELNRDDYYMCENDLYEDTLIVQYREFTEFDNDTIYCLENGTETNINDTLIINPTTTTQYVCYIPFQDTLIFDTVNVEISTCVSVESVKPINVQVFPNPAKDYIHVIINKSQSKNQTVIISDITGKISQVADIKQNTNFTIDVSNLTSGVYFIKIGAEVKKIIKQ